MSLLKRIQGVFFEARPTFEGLAAKPVWIDTLVVVLLALIAFNLVVAPYMQRDQLALMKDNAALKERLGEDSFAKMIERTENPSPASRIMQTFVITPLYAIVAILLQSLFLLILGLLVRAPGMAGPASIVGGVGGLLYWQNLTVNWESWAYAWALIPGFTGLGLFAFDRIGRASPGVKSAAKVLLAVSAVLFLVFAAALGRHTWSWIVLGAGLVAAGVLVVLRALRTGKAPRG